MLIINIFLLIVMADNPKKKKSGWDKIDPDLLAFSRKTYAEPPSEGGFPMPEELLRNRREWAKILEEQPLPSAEQAAESKEGGSTAAGRIGPRNPEHPEVNTKPGGRNPT
jgi:hypothetical protein